MTLRPRALALLMSSVAILAPACSSSDGPPKVTAPAPSVAWPHLACDPIAPTKCGFPFPSNVYTVDAADTPTGRRVALLPAMLPVSTSGQRSGGAPWAKSDGFSASGPILAHLPGAVEAGLPRVDDPARSLDPASPTVLLDADTGERVLHFAEIDRSEGDEEQRSLVIRPLVPLTDGRRYVVAIRGVRDASGGLVATSPAFAALRDLVASDEPSVEARRGLYEDVFAKLAAAGVGRTEVQLAWDFTTASRENVTGWLLHMRDEALAASGDAGPPYRVESVDDAGDPDRVAFRIHGVMTAPLYLDQPGPGARLQLGANGLPVVNAARATHEVPFEVIIPKAALTTPAALLQYGHGLLGSRRQIEAENFRKLVSDKNYVIFATDLAGMADDGDPRHISDALATGDLDLLSTMFDRLHQGMLNGLLAMRMMRGGFAKDAIYGAYLDPTKRYYHGISQGGIAGGVYMSVSTDVERGVLEVMGQPYSLLLQRSVDFNLFFLVMRGSYPDTRDQQLALALVQMLWDRVEPSGYTKYLRGGLPNTPPHEVLLRSALGDHQVPTWGAQVMARAVGAAHLDTGLGDLVGLTKVAEATSGSTYAEYDFGLPPEPYCNVPMNQCSDPHGEVRRLQEAEDQLDVFLREGRSVNACAAKVCRFPERSGCDGAPPRDLCAE